MTTLRRRWSFGLRTLFVVVTLLGVGLGWLAYQLNWIRERHAYLDQVAKRGGHQWYVIRSTDLLMDYVGPMPDAPFPLWIFGEVGITEVRADDPEQVARAERLFPEAYVGSPGIVVWPPSTTEQAEPQAAPAPNGAP